MTMSAARVEEDKRTARFPLRTVLRRKASGQFRRGGNHILDKTGRQADLGPAFQDKCRKGRIPLPRLLRHPSGW